MIYVSLVFVNCYFVSVYHLVITNFPFVYLGKGEYSSGPHSVTFPAGITTASIEIYIWDDPYLELINETFLLLINDLLLPKHITIGDNEKAIVTIVSNESKCVVKMFLYVFAIWVEAQWSLVMALPDFTEN